MSKIVSLSKMRKAKARADRKRVADENSVKFGRTKSQKRVEDMNADRARREIDGHKHEE